MMNSTLSNDSNIVVAKNGTAIKSLFLKLFGLAMHLSILVAGTNLAEKLWRAWGAC
jgi:hypothetical protein